MTLRKQPIVLSIAGSDNSGGAGIQADIKTCCAFGVYATTAITGVTSQNSRRVYMVENVSEQLLRSQIDSIFETMTPDAVKTGMLPSARIIAIVAEKMKEYEVKNLVVDPVMVATNGDSLVKGESEIVSEFEDSLLPMARVMTPNLNEAARFVGDGFDRMSPEEACSRLLSLSRAKAVLLKGGHSSREDSTDFLLDGSELTTFTSERIDTTNTHGTGCTLSSAIACGLARGKSLKETVGEAKEFITRAIRGAATLDICRGDNGPLDFFATAKSINP